MSFFKQFGEKTIMVRYTYGAISSGVPLGGIGAGKMEINSKGKMVNLTIGNSWAFPLQQMRGFHVFVRPEEGKPLFLEKGLPMKGFLQYEAERIEYEGKYPFAILRGGNLQVEVEAEFFSALIPGNLRDSSLPAFGLSVKVKGSKRGLIAISASNVVGFGISPHYNPVGRINERLRNGVRFMNRRATDLDPGKGETALVSTSPAIVIAQYNLNARPRLAIGERNWKGAYEDREPWTSLIDGEKPREDVHEVTGMWDDPAGLVGSEYGKGEEVRFVFSWYFTGRHSLYPYGHYYHNHFRNSVEVANYFLEEFDRLRRQSREWHDSLIPRDLPEWLRDAIVNSTYVLSSGTWLDEKGRFSIYEAPEVCPCVGTIAGLCYEGGSLPILKMFPELERKFLELLTEAMRSDGYVPHDLGVHSLDNPTDGTTAPPKWKDTNPTYVLLVYRYYKFTGDRQFLDKVYSNVIKAFRFTLTQDEDGDGIPDLEGQGDTGFDAMVVKGRDSYTASLYIASLMALREMARIEGDEGTLREVEERLRKARSSFEELFNGRYFEPWRGEPEVRDAVFLAQLLGQWWADLLGLGPIVEESRVERALSSILEVNARASNFSTPNLAHEDGRISVLSPQAYSSWPRLVFAMAWVGYRRAKDRETKERWLEVVRKEWSTLVATGVTWNQPSRVNALTGRPDPERFLDHYIGNPAIWSFTFS
jgi:non-lysosomal glucosylceramidase